MPSTIFEKDFFGMYISVREIKKHPCPDSPIAEHLHVGYLLVQFNATKTNIFMPPNFSYIKLATVKPSWNIKIREQCCKYIQIIEPGDIILDITYRIEECRGKNRDVITIFLKNLQDGFVTRQYIKIEHIEKPLTT